MPGVTETEYGSVDEALTGPIVKTPGCCGGTARLRGRRVPVWLLASWAQDGVSVSGILEFLPDLSGEEVEAALHYAELHKEEIDYEIRRNDEA